eukprot:492968_1
MAQEAKEESDDTFKSLTSVDELNKWVSEVDEDQNIILTFYDPKKEVASPMTERLQNIMDNEGIYTVIVAQIDRTKAKEDILKTYKVDCDCIIAIDRTKKNFPMVKKLTNFIEMSIKKLVINHKYKG